MNEQCERDSRNGGNCAENLTEKKQNPAQRNHAEFTSMKKEDAEPQAASISVHDFIRIFHCEQALALCSGDTGFYYQILGMIFQADSAFSDLIVQVNERRWDDVFLTAYRLKDLFFYLGLKKLYGLTREIYDYLLKIIPAAEENGQDAAEKVDPGFVTAAFEKLKDEYLYTSRMYEKILPD